MPDASLVMQPCPVAGASPQYDHDGKNIEFTALEKTCFERLSSLCAISAPVRSAYDSPEIPEQKFSAFCVQVIRHYRNQGASVAGQRPWNVRSQEMISRENHARRYMMGTDAPIPPLRLMPPPQRGCYRGGFNSLFPGN